MLIGADREKGCYDEEKMRLIISHHSDDNIDNGNDSHGDDNDDNRNL